MNNSTHAQRLDYQPRVIKGYKIARHILFILQSNERIKKEKEKEKRKSAFNINQLDCNPTYFIYTPLIRQLKKKKKKNSLTHQPIIKQYCYKNHYQQLFPINMAGPSTHFVTHLYSMSVRGSRIRAFRSVIAFIIH